MLILTRTIGESVLIGSMVKVTVLSRRGNEVSLGFDAPKEIAIVRKELEKKTLNKEGNK